MKLDKEQFVELFMQDFPELQGQVREELEFYGELLAHIIFPDLLFHTEALPDLLTLLKENQNPELIQRYCNFLERIYTDGDQNMQNVLVVSILEQLDDPEIWFRFGEYISNEFIRFINTEVIPYNCLMTQVPHLPYVRRRKQKA